MRQLTNCLAEYEACEENEDLEVSVQSAQALASQLVVVQEDEKRIAGFTRRLVTA